MRSKLFVPGSRPELFAKALAGPADAISIDLEDAVAGQRKAEARAATAAFLAARGASGAGKLVIVRVNANTTAEFEADVAAVALTGLDLIALPKTETAADVTALAALLAGYEHARGIARPIGILVNVESPRALRRAAGIAAADPRVAGLSVGFADLFEDLGIDRRDRSAVHQIQLAIRLAAGEAGVPAYDSAFTDVGDPGGYTREAEAARRLGYGGKSCIHPSQVPLANAVFQPSAAEIAHALAVVAAAETADAQGRGAFLVDGRMIDPPFVRRAETVVALARRLGLVAPQGGE